MTKNIVYKTDNNIANNIFKNAYFVQIEIHCRRIILNHCELISERNLKEEKNFSIGSR